MPPPQSRTCGLPASGSSVVLAFARTITVARCTAQLLLPAVRLAHVVPSCMPARVSFASCALPTGPSPCRRLSQPPTTMPDKTPRQQPAAARPLPTPCSTSPPEPTPCQGPSPLRAPTQSVSQYGCVGSPHPTGAFTRQETQSFARRNVVRSPPPTSQPLASAAAGQLAVGIARVLGDRWRCG